MKKKASQTETVGVKDLDSLEMAGLRDRFHGNKQEMHKNRTLGQCIKELFK